MENVIYIGLLLFIAGIIFFANREDRLDRHLPLVTWGLNILIMLVFLNQLLVILGTLSPSPKSPVRYDPGMVKVFIVVCTFGVAASLLLTNSVGARLFLERLLGSRKARYAGAKEPLFHPRSAVHKTALVLALAWITMSAFGFVASGGIEGMAEEYYASEASGSETSNTAVTSQAVGALLEGLLMNVGFALLGVGLFTRRTLAQTAARLGLRMPTFGDLLMGFGVGIGMYIAVFASGYIERLLMPEDVLEMQSAASASAVSAYAGSIFLWFLMALQAGIGEEILFRGALQPIFGTALTTFLFTVMHTQYALTFTWVTVFIGGLVLGWLRRRYSLVASMIAHATYNFMPALLVIIFVFTE